MPGRSDETAAGEFSAVAHEDNFFGTPSLTILARGERDLERKKQIRACMGLIQGH